MNFTRTLSSLAFFVGLNGVASAACTVGGPGSALIFPVFQSGGGRATLITITNTSVNTSQCSNSFRQGDVVAAFTYFNGDVSRGCVQANRFHTLTPGDTITVLQSADDPDPTARIGWLWVEARDPETLGAIDFDFLIGSAILADTPGEWRMRYLPYSFRSFPAEIVPTDGCGRAFTDFDSDGRADFDGREYDFWPNHLYLDQFLQQSATITSELFVATADTSLMDGSESVAQFRIFNNDERFFSVQFRFDCYLHTDLAAVSQVIRALGGNPNEFTVNGRPVQTGWIDVVGTDPILAVFLQKVGTGSVVEGVTLQPLGAYGLSGSGLVPASLHR